MDKPWNGQIDISDALYLCFRIIVRVSHRHEGSRRVSEGVRSGVCAAASQPKSVHCRGRVRDPRLSLPPGQVVRDDSQASDPAEGSSLDPTPPAGAGGSFVIGCVDM